MFGSHNGSLTRHCIIIKRLNQLKHYDETTKRAHGSYTKTVTMFKCANLNKCRQYTNLTDGLLFYFSYFFFDRVLLIS